MNNVVEVERQTEGRVVAVQYPETPAYTLTPELIGSLEAKYSHIANVDHADKGAVKELTAALAVVRSHRTTNKNEEETIKKPLNAFRAKVIEIGKKLRAEIEPLENRLKAEKQRIDDIKAEEKRAAEEKRLKLEREIQDNIMMIQAKAQGLFGLDLENLEARLDILRLLNLDDYEFGERIGDAGLTFDSAVAAVEGAIAQEKQRLEMVEQQRLAAQQQAELDRREAELRQQEAAQEQPAPLEAVIESTPCKQEPQDEAPKEIEAVEAPIEPPVESYQDKENSDEEELRGLVGDILAITENAQPAEKYTDPEIFVAVDKVLKTMVNAAGYLQSLRGGE